ncbi:signal peptidase I [Amycolatopsis sp. PS_44_ISF1]|uniref:signal peptidase I n=1 Tax=Amycolatopsis sp. PS_44_ISF1 TaxID=2974917 RepID=UPI0028DF5D52|nr:signal peptidase I [Amycolatopsis sp. PS_44_ISF1]MDT8912899.1 signal peptidase I [Amycolatopsis sp. PS_44_ISF1]
MADPIPREHAGSDPERPDPDDPGESSAPAGRGRRQRKKRPFWQELPILIVVALVLTILIQQFVGKVFMIPSQSMETTLHGCPGCFGDRVLVDRVTYDFTDPGPGDVIVFRGPPSWSEHEIAPQESGNFFAKAVREIGSLIGFAPPDEEDFVKRVIAVGGQTVQCCDPQGRVVVDGKALDEPYVHSEDPSQPVEMPFAPVKVPEGNLWVMGDNRENSCDSRCQGGGGAKATVPIGNVIGKARLIVLPPSRWGGVGDHNAQESATPVALGAPGWQQGLPLGVGAALSVPTVVLGRRMRENSGQRKKQRRRK